MEIIDVAAVQYGDCRGTIAIDSFGGGELHALAREKIPDGYFPVGFSISGLGDKNVAVYAVKCSEAGTTGDDVAAFAKERDEGNPLPVHEFEVKIEPEELASAIKRLDIVGKSRVVGDVPFGIVERHDPDYEE